ncbi:MAG: hypothetical protein R3F15_03190 [Lysobacterales bacterium]
MTQRHRHSELSDDWPAPSQGDADLVGPRTPKRLRLTLLCVGKRSELEPARMLAQRLRLQGEDAVLLLAPTLRDMDCMGAELAPAPRGIWRRGPGGLWWLRRLIRRLQPDRIVIGAFTSAAVAAVLAGRGSATALAAFEPIPFSDQATLSQGLGVEVCLRSWLRRAWRGDRTSALLAGARRWAGGR